MKTLIRIFSFCITVSLSWAGVSIHGNVKKAGSFTVQKDLTLPRSLDLAGGVSVFGHSVIVYRDKKEAGWIYIFEDYRRSLPMAKSFAIKDGDVIYVTGKRWNGIKVPGYISNAVKATNKVCYRIRYGVYQRQK